MIEGWGPPRPVLTALLIAVECLLIYGAIAFPDSRNIFLLSAVVLLAVFFSIKLIHRAGGGEFTPTEITLKEVAGSDLKELMDERLTFIDPNDVKWIAPQGTQTDGASVPWYALWITDGRFKKGFLKAAVVHDAYCQEDNKTRCPGQYRTKPWQAVHEMFYDACIAGGTRESTAKMMFTAVWLAGPRWSDPDTVLQQDSDERLIAGASACKKWVGETNPTVEEIATEVDRRRSVLFEISQLENVGLAALFANDLGKAGLELQQAETLLTEALGKSPDDLMLLNLKGYLEKSRAILFRKLHMEEKANTELNQAEKTFQGVVTIEPRDPSALNGLGSVFLLRLELDRAEQYVREALSIAPYYRAAKHDLAEIERQRTLRQSD